MWLFDKLKAIGNAIVNAICSLNLFGKKPTPVVQIAKPPKPIKHIVIPQAPKPPTEQEIMASCVIKKHEYSNPFARPAWANKLYDAYINGSIGSPEQLKTELDSHRLLYQARAIANCMPRLVL
jgi:hypothetical protein